MRTRLFILGLVLFAGLVLFSCTEKNIYNSCPNHSVCVSGEVLAWFCGVRDGYNPTPEPRYTVATGKKAIVRFVSIGGSTFAIETDDSSSFETWIERGVYNVVIEIGHAHPFTLQHVQIAGDTALELNTLYEYYTSDTVDFCFFYPDAGDSLGKEAELAHILPLRRELWRLIDFTRAQREVYVSPYTHYADVRYRIPLEPGCQAWEAYEQAELVKSWLGGFPESFYVSLDFCICMWAPRLQPHRLPH